MVADSFLGEENINFPQLGQRNNKTTTAALVWGPVGGGVGLLDNMGAGEPGHRVGTDWTR